MSGTYSELASFYNTLNGGIDYDKWVEFIDLILKKHGVPKRTPILDAGCGTGQITVRLAGLGYDMIGADISPEMLAVAREFADERRVKPLFICQNMSSIELYGSVAAAISTLDSVNYLTKKEDLFSFFSLMHNYIESGGILVFDVNTKKKFEEFYGQNDYVIDEDGVFCGWQNDYSKNSHIATFYLNIFEELPDGNYRRRFEVQKERYYPDKTLVKMLEETGFEIADVYSDIDFSPAGKDDMRHFYVCKKV